MTTSAEPAAGQPNHGPLASVYTGPLPSGLTDWVDVLVNNAGGLFPSPATTADGYEATVALNVQAPVALSGRLGPLLAATTGRCGTVVSSAFAEFQRGHGDRTAGPPVPAEAILPVADAVAATRKHQRAPITSPIRVAEPPI